MKSVRRVIGVGAMLCAVVGVMSLISCTSTGKDGAPPQNAAAGQWVDPANPSDELVNGPYRVDPNWPKPLAESFPDEKGWTWGAVQGVFAQNPDRIFVAMRGELPDSDQRQEKSRRDRDRGRHDGARRGARARHVRAQRVGGPVRQPGRSHRRLHGRRREGLPLETHHHACTTARAIVKEAWTQWDSLFKPDNPKVLSQGRVHKILISPYDPEKRVWAIDDGHQVIRIFSNDGKKLLQTIGTLNTTTERNAKMTGNTGRPSLTKKTGPSQRDLRPSDRHRVAAGRHLLRHRRLRGNARREIRQGRQVPDGVGRAGRERQGDAAELLQHRARHRHRQPAPDLRQRPRQPAHPGLRRERQVPQASGTSATDPPRRITST